MKIFKVHKYGTGNQSSLILFERVNLFINFLNWGLELAFNYIKPNKDNPKIQPYRLFIMLQFLCIRINIPIRNPHYDKQVSMDYWKEKFKEKTHRAPIVGKPTTKLEVIDNVNSLGAVYRYINDDSNIEVSYRDSNETLKVFINSKRKED